jgi:histidinol-phosphate aminotransferase
MPQPKSSILTIKAYKPGKSGADGTGRIVKLSSNENPLGPSPAVFEVLEKASRHLHRYPDGSHSAVREAIGKAHNLPADQIICGAGSDELIGLLVQAYTNAGDEVLYPKHSFLMYKIYALAHGAVPREAPANENYGTDVDALLAAVTEKTRMVFIANPNNPTGSYIGKDALHKLRQGLPEDVILVIDNAYAEYMVEEDYSRGEELVSAANNTVTLRTFSKIYGIPGLRLGWAYAPEAMIDILNRIRSPFNVNSLAQAAGIAAVQDEIYTRHVREYNNTELARVSEALAEDYKIYPSFGNFVMVDFGSEQNAQKINQRLLSQGIIVREIAAYGLGQCLRISIGTEEENNQLLAALKKESAA